MSGAGPRSDETRRKISATHRFNYIRSILNAPPRDEDVWLSMTRGQREAVLIAAGLPAEWSTRRWRSMTGSERIKINDQVLAFSRWAQRLMGPK